MEEMRKGGREDGSNGRWEERGKAAMKEGRTREMEEGRKGMGGMEPGREGERMGGMENGRNRRREDERKR